MNKIILLIGLLTYSSVGWSEILIMKCRSDIFKLDTDKPNHSDQLLTVRVDGKWEGFGCANTWKIKKNVKCQKGDGSVIMEWTNNITTKRTKSVWDFRYPSYNIESYNDDGGIYYQSSRKCESK